MMLVMSSRVQLLDFDNLAEGALPQRGEDFIWKDRENRPHLLRVVQWAAPRTKAGIGIPSLTFTFRDRAHPPRGEVHYLAA